MSDDIAIKVNQVNKTFKLPHEKNSSLKGALINFSKRGYEKQQVLENISFEIKNGEFFGIVGRNGSGKSTLLKLLAHIYVPDSGSIEINGKLTPFIELGVGFNPELTGRENIFLNGALLGFNRKEIQAMYKDIVDFSELERFMDQKLKNYSSGMQVRLAFSVAIRAETDILLIDEVLAVGDQSFQEKCFDFFLEAKRIGRTIVFVTHDMSNVERFCDRVFVIDRKKEINGLYTIPAAVALYNQLNHENVGRDQDLERKDRPSKGSAFIKKVELLNSKGESVTTVHQGQQLSVRLSIESKFAKPVPITVGLAFHEKDGTNMAGPNSLRHPLTTKSKTVTYKLNSVPFNMGEYYLTVALFDEKATKQYDLLDKELKFFVNTDETQHGKIVLEGSWSA